MPPTTVLIVDDHAMLRSGLRLLIDAQPDLKVVGEAGTLQEAVDAATKHKPHVITLDLSLPGSSGVASVQRLRAASPTSKLLVVTMHDDPAFVRAAVAMGASGYLVKSAADAELIVAIRAVAAGRTFVILDGNRSFERIMSPNSAEQPSPLESLSEREREVLAEVAKGYTNREIADRVGLSIKTVESYRSRLMQKLGLQSRADLIRLAVETGILGMDNDPHSAKG